MTDISHGDIAEVRRALHYILEQAPDIGIRKIVAGWLLEPVNRFDPLARRKPKPEILLLIGYLLLLALIFAVFNRS